MCVITPKISDTPIDQNFFPPPEVDVLRWHRHTDRTTDRQTDKYGASMTIYGNKIKI